MSEALVKVCLSYVGTPHFGMAPVSKAKLIEKKARLVERAMALGGPRGTDPELRVIVSKIIGLNRRIGRCVKVLPAGE